MVAVKVAASAGSGLVPSSRIVLRTMQSDVKGTGKLNLADKFEGMNRL